ncbi:Tc toxin subunit A, partial [Cyanothece sp. BG0011]|uniref:Tc toxin subunit A n=1 Tax=Cyanothece sp. BG0011 TaxID=2082950 RepID=UPI0018E51102
MRIEHEGILLWYGTPDAPAPDNIVSASDKVAITVGVQPVDASNAVEVRYRVNQGKFITIPAQFLKNGRGLTSQYFRASLPAFEPGDIVEYTAICRCAGRQVPSVDDLGKFTSSFTVVEAGSQINNNSPDSSQNQQISSNESINTNLKDAQFVQPEETAQKEEEILSRLSTRKKKHLKNLTAGITEEKQKEKLKQLFSETEGEFNPLKTRLEESEEFDPESIKKLTFKHEVAELLEDQENWIAACTQNSHINCLRDIALNYKKQDFKSLISAAGIPEDAQGEDEEDCLEKCATRVCDRLFQMIPTAVVQRMVRDEEIAIDDPKVREGIFSVLNDHPDLDFRKTSVLEVLQDPDCLKSVSEEHRDKVADELKNLQRLSVLSPEAEAVPTLLKRNLTSAYAINEVPMERFVRLYADQLGGEKIARAVHRNAQNITARNEEAYVALRQAVTGPPVRMINGDSATVERQRKAIREVVQQNNILINFETLFGSVDLCECKHCNSVYSPAAYLVELFQYLRNNNLDPDYENTGKSGYSQTPLEMFFRRRPDLGHLQLTCENTNTLIPYVDLVNEVMESFIFNLSKYENDTLTPKRASIRVHNVEDESSGELLAEPQHTNYYTYKRLSNTVYPVCKLPYHQPIDATREYLKYLGTSRYELFDTFRADVPLEVEENVSDAERERASRKQELDVLAVDRAIAAEFLHLTEEEYIILTKEGFQTKEWYELEEKTSLTLSQYRQKIGFKNTWDYYGIQSEDQMIEELKWVKPAQDTGMVGFLRRVNIQYTDLIELLKTRYINPNYLSGKDLAYMNSLRYSYRYLQSLVDETQTDIKLKYQKLVAFLQSEEVLDTKDFSEVFVECWIYKNFAKIGKLIVLESGGSECACPEGYIYFHQKVLYLHSDCRVMFGDEEIGYLDIEKGNIVVYDDPNSQYYIDGKFEGIDGSVGEVARSVLLINNKPFTCNSIFTSDYCDLSKTQLKHLDGTALTVAEYDRFHRFIRLWCKLGWTIYEVDQAIIGIGETIEKPPFKPLNFLASNRFVALMPSKKESTEKPSSQRSKFSASSSFTALPPS